MAMSIGSSRSNGTPLGNLKQYISDGKYEEARNQFKLIPESIPYQAIDKAIIDGIKFRYDKLKNRSELEKDIKLSHKVERIEYIWKGLHPDFPNNEIQFKDAVYLMENAEKDLEYPEWNKLLKELEKPKE